MKHMYRLLWSMLVLMLGTVTANAGSAWPANYDGVMLQGFYWDSYSETSWSKLEAQSDELSKYFQLIWVPNSGKAASNPGMGYDPVYWFTNHNSSFGTEAQLRSMIKTFKSKGTGIIADVVINHRSGATNWCDFPSETWNGVTYKIGMDGICRTDECAANGYNPTGAADEGEDFNGSRDLDHTNANVQANCKAYTKFLLEDLGYTGFRYDMVKGYAGYYTGQYNAASGTQFSVGEYWDGNYDYVAHWIDTTSEKGGGKSAAFDFPCKYAINEAFSTGDMTKLVWKANGTTDQPAGLIHYGYPQYAVTFVDNHDTYRDGSKFTGNVLAANAFIICSPGTPCVFWPHYTANKAAIQALINARRAVGITNTSAVKVLRTDRSCYMAEVTGTKGKLVVKVGSAMVSPSGYTDSQIATSGTDYCVWTTADGGVTPTPTPDPVTGDTPSKLYLLGNFGGDFSPYEADNIAMTKSGDKFTATGVELKIGTSTDAYFGFATSVAPATATAANAWDMYVNATDRYGAATKDATINGSAPMQKFAAGNNASSAYSWKVPVGVYDITADFSTMTVSVTKTGDVTIDPTPDPDPDPTPDPTPSGDDVYVYVEGLSAANIYVYNDGGQMTTWDAAPAMTSDATTGCLAYKLPDAYKTSQVIIKNGTTQYPAANQPGLQVSGKSMKLVWSTKTWAEYQGSTPNPNPDPDPDPTPAGDITIYYDNSVTSWSTVNCYSFVNNTANNGAWPGKAMTLVSGKVYSITIPAGSSVVFNAGNNQPQTVDVADVQDKHLYKGLATMQANGDGKQCNKVEDRGVYGDNPDPDPDPVGGDAPAQLYLLGNFGGDFSPYEADNITMTKSGDKFTATGVELKIGTSTDAYFGFATSVAPASAPAADAWDLYVNATDRYGATAQDATIDGSAPMQKFAAGVSASSAYSWKVPVGIYTITADFSTMTVTATKTGDVEIDPEPVPDPDPDPDPDPVGGDAPAQLYLLGNFGGDFSPYEADNITMTKSGDKFTATGVELKIGTSTDAYFGFATSVAPASAPAADAWDLYVNATDRYGATAQDATIDGSAPMQKFAAGVSASSAYSWKVPVGIYTITADFSTMTVTATKTGDVEIDPEPVPDPDPDPDPEPGNVPDQLYIIGNTGGDFSPYLSGMIEMEKSGDVFTATDVHLYIGTSDDAYFAFATAYAPEEAAVADAWDLYVNASVRYGAATKDAPIDGMAEMVMYAAGAAASQAYSWMVPTGVYTIVADFYNMTVTATKSSSIGDVNVEGADDEVRYFNLQGVEVENPSAGLYIVVRNGNATKQLIK